MEISTIAAISTPPGHGGVGIIRISGPEALSISLSVFEPKKPVQRQDVHFRDAPPPSFSPKSRYLYHGHIVDRQSGHIIDEVLFVVMRKPASYTGEDVVEIQSHAGQVVLQSILQLLIGSGVSLAAPGEFTRRAFLNGRMDLTQAEAVMDLIAARSEKAMEMAAAQLSGDLSRKISAIRASLVEILSNVEAAIDFPDEVGDAIDEQNLMNRLDDEVISEIIGLIELGERRAFLREGVKVVIVGGPNVGKSSLMNCLVERQRCIVSDIPGTTRDFIEDIFFAGGIPIVLVDTAGVHGANDPVELMGIDQTWTAVNGADLVLFVVDAGQEISQREREMIFRLSGKTVFLVINKIDLPDSRFCVELPEEWRLLPSFRISALYNRGIDRLKKAIIEAFNHCGDETQDTIVPNLRQKHCLQNALAAIEIAREGFVRALPLDLVSLDLTAAFDSLGEITGDIVKPDILDQIFSRFCIGK